MPSSMEKPTSAKMLEVSAIASAPSSRLESAMCIDTNRISRPPVVPMNPIGGSRFAYIEMRWA